MTAESTETGSQARRLRKTVAAGTIGTLVEWYDFYLYGFASAVVFNKLFFPQLSNLTGTLASFGAYAFGYVARPLGGVFFGRLGDHIGRRPVTIITVTIMGTATFAIGLLPTYATIGVWAPILLTIARLAQGFAAGAEWGGATLLTAETAPPRRRAFYASIPTGGVAVSIVFAIGVLQVLTGNLTNAQFLDWGWRIPFLASIVLLAVGLFLRMRVHESPEFDRLRNRRALSRQPIRDLLEKQRVTLLMAIFTRVGEVASSYVIITFFLTYLENEKVSSNTGLTTVLVSAAVGIVTIPLFGMLSDRIGRRMLYMLGSLGLIVFAFPYFAMLDTGNTWMIMLASLITFSGFYCAISGAQPGLYSEIFDIEFRFTGLVITRELTAAIIGGTTPLIATALLIASGGRPWPIALYMMGVCVVAAIGLIGLSRLARRQRVPDPRPQTAVGYDQPGLGGSDEAIGSTPTG